MSRVFIVANNQKQIVEILKVAKSRTCFARQLIIATFLPATFCSNKVDQKFHKINTMLNVTHKIWGFVECGRGGGHTRHETRYKKSGKSFQMFKTLRLMNKDNGFS